MYHCARVGNPGLNRSALARYMIGFFYLPIPKEDVQKYVLRVDGNPVGSFFANSLFSYSRDVLRILDESCFYWDEILQY